MDNAQRLRNLRIAFDESLLTHFAGMALIHAFCTRLGLKWLLQHALRPGPRYRDYHPAEMLRALLYAIIAGLDRINTTQILQYNGAFRRIVGLPRFPNATALRRFLKRLHPRWHPGGRAKRKRPPPGTRRPPVFVVGVGYRYRSIKTSAICTAFSAAPFRS